MTNNSLATEIFINVCKKAGVTPDIVYESDHIDMILGFVSGGLGVSLLTSQIAKKFIKGNNIKIVNLNEKINVTIALAIPKEKNSAPGIRAFKKYTLEWFKK